MMDENNSDTKVIYKLRYKPRESKVINYLFENNSLSLLK